MKKRFASLLALLALLSCFGLSAFAVSNPEFMAYDEAGVLTAEGQAELNEQAIALSEQYNFEVVLYYSADMYGRTAQALADDYYDVNGFGFGENWDGIVLMVCPGEREYAFSTCGSGLDMFDGHRLDVLETAVVSCLRDNDWYGAGKEYLDTCSGFLAEGLPQSAGGSAGGSKSSGSLIVSVMFAVFGGIFGVCFPLGLEMSKLKSVAIKRGAADYVAKNGVNLTQSHDRYIRTFETRRVIQSSSGGSGNGAHRSSSGRSHGGRSGRF